VAVRFDGWGFTPITTSAGQTHSIVALAGGKDDDASAPLLNVIWFTNENGGWTGRSWRGATRRAALGQVKAALDLPDETDGHWPTVMPEATNAAVEPEEVASGVFADDPMRGVIEAHPDRLSILGQLRSAGWEPSDAEVFESPCRQQQLLDELASGFTLVLAGPDGDDDTMLPCFEAIWNSECEAAAGSACPEAIGYGPTTTTVVTTMYCAWISRTTTATGGQCWLVDTFRTVEGLMQTRSVYITCPDCSATLCGTQSRLGTDCSVQ